MLPWFERNLRFGHSFVMLPYFLERLSGTAIRMENKLIGVSDEILSNKLDGKWSIKQNIGHLAEVDLVANKRIDEMVNGAPTLSPAVFEPKDYNPWPIREVLDIFIKARKENIKKYESLSPEDLKKSSLHPRLKMQMTPNDLAWFDAEHDDHHLVRISDILRTLRKQHGRTP
jgi:hypothetical protein